MQFFFCFFINLMALSWLPTISVLKKTSPLSNCLFTLFNKNYLAEKVSTK